MIPKFTLFLLFIIISKASEVDIVHDIPIKVLKASDIVYYSPPEVPPPKVRMNFNQLNSLYVCVYM
jgi:hypothetical protein